MMRKSVCISMIACFAAVSVFAQTPVSVTEQNVGRHGQNLVVTFKLTAADDAAKNGEKILVTSMLTPSGVDTAESVTVGHFYIAGNQQQKIELQKLKLSKAGEDIRFIRNGESLTFVEAFPYDAKLGSRSYELSFSAVKMGCCNTDECLSEEHSFSVGPAMTPVVQDVVPCTSTVKGKTPRYPFIHMVGSDTDVERGVSVRFPVAKTQLDSEFSSNAEALRDIVDALKMVKSDEWAELKAIDIAGYASPEGDAGKNQELSLGRAMALKEYLMQALSLEDDKFNIAAGGEDWSGLRALVASSDMPHRKEVLDIIDNVPQEQRQARLKALGGGRPYRSMLDMLYPQLRDACSIRVWIAEKEDVAAEDINEAVKAIESGRYEEALEKLMTHKDDPRAWNAIGSVKVLTEDLKDARKWFAKAAKAGDGDAVRNLAQLEEILD